jgi:uncharacterized protein (DUF1778 family)
MTKKQRLKRNNHVTLRLTDDDIQLAEKAAKLLSLNRAEFIREAIRKQGLLAVRRFKSGGGSETTS